MAKTNDTMPFREHAQFWFVPHLNNLSLLRATFVTYSFKRHTHDYFVVAMVEGGWVGLTIAPWSRPDEARS
jgi:hypothetical protein